MSEYCLIGIDGNAYSIMGYVSDCMKKEGQTDLDIEIYFKNAKSGNYNNLLRISQEKIEELNK